MSLTSRVRQLHRYLGLFIGLQFLFWTVGGLYFSWTNLDEIHGDHLREARRRVPADVALASPSQALAALRAQESVEAVTGLGLVDVLGRPTYQVHYRVREGAQTKKRTRLADALTGQLRPALSREEAVRLAQATFTPGGAVRSVERLTQVGRHHEYRSGPLPAWAVTFEHPQDVTVYVSAEQGEVRTMRHRGWRVFDFFWMLHTMDYEGRDDINNTLLRAFSVLGLVTLLSGFALFALTSRRIRGWLGMSGRRA